MPAGPHFPSRVDRWFVAVVFAAAATPLGAAGWLAMQGRFSGVLLLAAWGGAMIALTAWLGFPCGYAFADEGIEVRSGPLRWTVPYPAIRAAGPTWVPLPGPAWSLRRVRLDFADGFILVSPDAREVFISELAERCPHLMRRGAGLAKRLPLPHEKAAR